MSCGVIRRRFLAPVATTAWCLSNVPAWLQYRRALKSPASVQERLLLRHVRRNTETVFGLAHDFAGIRSVDDYRARVPLRRYEDYEPLVQRIAEGESRVLPAEGVTRLAVTSGSITPRVVRIRDGFQGFASRSVVRGRRLGDVKPAALDLDGGWSEVFTSVASDPAGDGRPCTTH